MSGFSEFSMVSCDANMRGNAIIVLILDAEHVEHYE